MINTASRKGSQNKGLWYYLVANIAVLILLSDFFYIPQLGHSVPISVMISNLLGIVIVSAVMLILTITANSLFGQNLKGLLVIGRSPGEKIFSRIRKGNFHKQFSTEEALRIYSGIYKALPEKKKDRYVYENNEWYKIYDKYRDIAAIKVLYGKSLLYRDYYFSTIIVIVIYLVLTLVFKVLAFSIWYTGYLTIILIVSYILTRNKSTRFACSVIAHDITNQKTK
jgi:hypothetical protein